MRNKYKSWRLLRKLSTNKVFCSNKRVQIVTSVAKYKYRLGFLLQKTITNQCLCSE